MHSISPRSSSPGHPRTQILSAGASTGNIRQRSIELRHIQLPDEDVLVRDFCLPISPTPLDCVHFRNHDLSAYKSYYISQWSSIAGQPEVAHATIQTYDDLALIVRSLRLGMTRECVIESLKATSPHPRLDKHYENSLNLAARLLTMLKIGRAENQVVARNYLDWSADSLAELTQRRFCGQPILECAHVRLPKTFNAWSLSAVGGLLIEFTDNMADHLLLVNDDTKVLIFHHATFLEYQEDNNLFPAGFIEETRNTLALLFPQALFGRPHRDKDHRRAWLKKLILDAMPCEIDLRLGQCGTLRAEQRQIEHFRYWRDRLVILKQAFDEASPTTITQFWHDRRNGERWYTFWVAIMVFVVTTFLGLVQCIASGLQVYKAYYPS